MDKKPAEQSCHDGGYTLSHGERAIIIDLMSHRLRRLKKLHTSLTEQQEDPQ